LEQASDELRSLTSEDWNKAQSVVMAGFQVSLRYLSTDKVKFPRQCADFLSILIAASNGNTGWFELSDKRIAEITNISPKTVARGRDALVKYQQESGKGVVSIKAETAKPTFYKVNLLEAVSSLIHKAMSGENASTEAMLTVAGVSGRLLTEGTDKVRTEVSDEDLAKAKALNSDLRTAVDSLPEPELVIADNVIATKLAGYKKRFETFRADLGTALEQAHDAGLEATVTALQTLATKAKELGEKLDADGLEPDFATIDADLAKAKAEIAEVGQGKVAEAKAKAEAEKAEKGEVSEETRRAVAQANIEATADLESETANSYENFSQAVYLLAEATANDPEAKQTAYLACIEIVNNAFQLGQYKAQA